MKMALRLPIVLFVLFSANTPRLTVACATGRRWAYACKSITDAANELE